MSSSLHRPRRITAKVRMCRRVVFTPNTCYGDVSSLGPVEEKDDRVRGDRFRLDDPITDRCSHDHRRYSRVTDQTKPYASHSVGYLRSDLDKCKPQICVTSRVTDEEELMWCYHGGTHGSKVLCSIARPSDGLGAVRE